MKTKQLITIGSERHLSAALILLFSTARDGDGTHDVASLYDRQGTAAGHDSTVARDDQALKPCLPGDPRQLLRRLLEARGRIGFVQGDFNSDGTGAVHSAQRDHTAALVNNHRCNGDVQLRGL